jgi:hypothetical protein
MNLQITAVTELDDRRQRPGAIREFQFPEYSDLGNRVNRKGRPGCDFHSANPIQ